MASNGDLLRYISGLSAQQILNLIPDDVLLSLVPNHQQLEQHHPGDSTTQAPTSHQKSTHGPLLSDVAIHLRHPNVPIGHRGSLDKAKRPLNAFIAYRSYYKSISMFAKIPQKEVSAYLTLLWAEDPFRNKWALIAKVYSFVRDEVGKSSVNLGDFLAVACPIMAVIPPERYLEVLGWTQNRDEDGTTLIVQDKEVAQHMISDLEDHHFPDTELELLVDCIETGYLPAHRVALAEKLASNSNSIITTKGWSSIHEASSHTALYHAVVADPVGAAAELLDARRDDASLALGVDVITFNRGGAQVQKSATEDGNNVTISDNHSMMEAMASSRFSPRLDFESLPGQDTYDIMDSQDMERLLRDGSQAYFDSIH